jgi:hypothetical protein
VRRWVFWCKRPWRHPPCRIHHLTFEQAKAGEGISPLHPHAPDSHHFESIQKPRILPWFLFPRIDLGLRRKVISAACEDEKVLGKSGWK